MLEYRQQVLDGIRECLGPEGFDAESTYRDWIAAFQRIQSLSADRDGDCVWSAPVHPEDMKPEDWPRFVAALEELRAKFLETGQLDVRDGSRGTGNE